MTNSIYRLIFSIIIISTLSSVAVFAQKWVNPNFMAHRLDYRDLGYPAANEIEADNSPIAALLGHSNGRIYGATTGKQSYLIAFDQRVNKVLPLGKIASEEGVFHSIVEGPDGLVYIGTGKNELKKLHLTKDIPGGRRTIEDQLWKDIQNKYKDYAGGHIYVYDPEKGDGEAYLNEDQAKVTDLGIPVPKNSIYCMVADGENGKIYGITYPDAHFFELDLASKKLKDHGAWLEKLSYAGPERYLRSVPRSLVVGKDGKVYSSGDDGLITVFNPEKATISQLNLRIPGEYWEAWNYNGFPVIDQMVKKDSLIYGGTSDGFIFQLDISKNKILNLGKPRWGRRVRAMALGNDEAVYMICGEWEDVCKMYSFDTSNKQNGFTEFGVLGVDRSPYYAKRPYQFDYMVKGTDGTIFIGESDRRAKLFIYQPGGGVFDGTLNSSNPR
ncbi:PQQ-binding-like beta-propeller repeat protein [Flexithrix dorotheae]|uniref:PQQ-binding-like beta-propeller repeat protein n=1 Tax=Flexithrix dorotheae TaxID=70993 RepID=UPI00036EB96D|nr:PQQ-binding-like beta-propeller repeat protein [Flexithrix dorotheae]